MITLTQKSLAKRNLKPHKAAVFAMCFWGQEYAAQNGGSMDFWDKLTPYRKQLSREIVCRIIEAPKEEA